LTERRQAVLWAEGIGKGKGGLAGKTQINDTQLRQIARFHVGDVLFEVHFVLCVCVCSGAVV